MRVDQNLDRYWNRNYLFTPIAEWPGRDAKHHGSNMKLVLKTSEAADPETKKASNQVRSAC